MADIRGLLIDIAIIVVFMVGIGVFRTPSGARLGNWVTALAFGVAIALVFARNTIGLPWLVAASFALGALAGWYVTVKVTMTRIPALIALQNGAGGGASLLVSSVELTRTAGELDLTGAVFAYIGVLVGAVALSGSVLAALKLENKIDSRPKSLKGHDIILATSCAVFLALALGAVTVHGSLHVLAILILGILALYIGVLFAMRVGGADMPVLISFLNTLSGLAAAFVGVAVGNQMLIAAGAMVGSSGLILTWVMCKSMNRTLLAVLLGRASRKRASTAQSAPSRGSAAVTDTDSLSTLADGVAPSSPVTHARAALDSAESVIIVPGYGMAQAHAQFDVALLARTLEEAGKRVRFAVHPVAGRMPGHMHVLLAEADVDYEKLFEMDAINDDFATTDAVLIVGACDVVNPAAITMPDTPISGMPILRAHEAGSVIVCNLDDKPGYSGVANPLYDDAKAILLFGDAKHSLEELRAGA